MIRAYYEGLVFSALLRTVYFPISPVQGLNCDTTCGGVETADVVGCSNLPPLSLPPSYFQDGPCWFSGVSPSGLPAFVQCQIHPCTHTKVRTTRKVITDGCFGLITVPSATVYDCSIDPECFADLYEASKGGVYNPWIEIELPYPDFGSPPFPADVIEYQRIQQAVGDDVAGLARWGETVKKLRTKERVVPLPEVQTRPYIEVSPDTLPELAPAPDTLIDPSIPVSPVPIPIPLPPDLDTDPYIDVFLDLSPQGLTPYINYLLTQEAVQSVALINQIEESLDDDCQTQEQMLYANFEGMKDLLVQSFVGLAWIFGFISAILVSMSIFELWKNIPIRRV
jgi:hypothetical protein